MGDSWQGSDRSSRLPSNWTALKAEVYRTKGRRCHLCGKPGADTVDHIMPGDDHSLSNLAPVHDAVWPHCHRSKSSAEGNTTRWKHTRKRTSEPHPGIKKKS